MLKTRTSRGTAKKRIPKWVIAVVLLLIAGTGIYFIYNSFASTSESLRIVYCNNNLSDCRRVRTGYYSRGKSANTRQNDRCVWGTPNSVPNGGAQYKLTERGSSWKCLY